MSACLQASTCLPIQGANAVDPQRYSLGCKCLLSS